MVGKYIILVTLATAILALDTFAEQDSKTTTPDSSPFDVIEPRRAVGVGVESSTTTTTATASVDFGFGSGNEDLVPEPRSTNWQMYPFSSLGESVVLTSTNYPYSYGEFEDDGILFVAPTNLAMSFQCGPIITEMPTLNSCDKDFMSISFTGRTDFSDGFRVCGQENSLSLTSASNKLAFAFRSGRRMDIFRAFGFKCSVTVVLPTTTTAAATTTAATTTTTTTTTKAPTTATTSKAPTTIMTTRAPATVITTKAPTTATIITTKAPAPTTATATATSSSATGNTTASSCTCGVKNQGARIVNGEVTAKNEIPWRCFLYAPTMGPFCGCTVIDNSWIMTAAHCTNAVPAGTKLTVVSGDYDYSIGTETQAVARDVDRYVQHPAYDSKTQDNDISLLHLSTPLNWSKTVSPACLPLNADGMSCDSPVNVMASGWGTTSSGGEPSSVMKKVELSCMSSTACAKYYPQLISNNMICTYTPGKDACQGDSGGSIDMMGQTSGRYTAIGVVSWGIGCAAANKPGVYTKVTNYIPWIQQTATGANFCRP